MSERNVKMKFHLELLWEERNQTFLIDNSIMLHDANFD